MDEKIIKCPLCGLWHPLPEAGACNIRAVDFGRGFSAGYAISDIKSALAAAAQIVEGK